MQPSMSTGSPDIAATTALPVTKSAIDSKELVINVPDGITQVVIVRDDKRMKLSLTINIHVHYMYMHVLHY